MKLNENLDALQRSTDQRLGSEDLNILDTKAPLMGFGVDIVIRALVFGVYIGALILWKLSYDLQSI